MKSLRRAFTLIELLVVIAIIAILAAILFPVFAQAKAAAKKSVCISNLKQQSLGVIQYMGDSDDAGPQALPNILGGWNQGYIGWQFPCSSGEANTDCLEWGNAVQPYMKSTAILVCPSVTGKWNPYGNGGTTPSTSYTYNGNMQFSSETSVVAPATTVMLWSGLLSNSWNGRIWASPLLSCDDPKSSCVYQTNNGGNTCSGNGCSDGPVVYGGYPSYNKWIHSRGDTFAYVDGHAKYRTLNGDYTSDPWSVTTSTGDMLQGGGYGWWDNNGHTCLFGLDNPCGL